LTNDRPPLLETRGLTKRFGGLVAIDDLSFELRHGEICGIIGPNGAGKSTLVGLLGGALTPSSGTIAFAGADVTALPASERARRGIGRTYQIPRPFLDMTVRENIFVAIFSVAPLIPHHEAQQRSDEILERTGLADAADSPARGLQLIRRKRLELARALALRPKVLLLDEIGAGLIDSEVTELIGLVKSLRGEIDAILIIEHVMRVVRECCERLVVLHFGRLLGVGPTAEILASDDVAAVYLGTQNAGGDAPLAAAPADAGAPVDAGGPADADQPASARTGLASVVMLRSSNQQGAGAKPIVSLRGLCAGYGQTRVLHEIDLDVAAGSSVAILGPNGAGKTTLSRTICGMLKPTSGQRFIAGNDVTQLAAHRIAALGIGHCMEGRRIFAALSVEENLLIAARGITKADQKQRLAVIYELFPILAERRNLPGTAMSGGQQQMLAIGRALMARPSLVIFDEVSLGLAPVMVERLYEALRILRAAGLAMLVVEQNVDRALELADEVHVLEQGTIALSGSPGAIRNDPRLRHLYVGETEDVTTLQRTAP
jgi:branched-chain amino acid transport system ATP-binding protein